MTFSTMRFVRQHFFLFAVLLLSLQTIQRVAATQIGSPDLFAGRWTDHENTDIIMSIREDTGLFRVIAGDEAYGYNLSCLAKDLKAVCTGSGGRLEGENFLYQSTFALNQNGTMTEHWKAFNNLQTVNGKTMWQRQK